MLDKAVCHVIVSLSLSLQARQKLSQWSVPLDLLVLRRQSPTCNDLTPGISCLKTLKGWQKMETWPRAKIKEDCSAEYDYRIIHNHTQPHSDLRKPGWSPWLCSLTFSTQWVSLNVSKNELSVAISGPRMLQDTVQCCTQKIIKAHVSTYHSSHCLGCWWHLKHFSQLLQRQWRRKGQFRFWLRSSKRHKLRKGPFVSAVCHFLSARNSLIFCSSTFWSLLRCGVCVAFTFACFLDFCWSLWRGCRWLWDLAGLCWSLAICRRHLATVSRKRRDKKHQKTGDLETWRDRT